MLATRLSLLATKLSLLATKLSLLATKLSLLAIKLSLLATKLSLLATKLSLLANKLFLLVSKLSLLVRMVLKLSRIVSSGKCPEKMTARSSHEAVAIRTRTAATFHDGSRIPILFKALCGAVIAILPAEIDTPTQFATTLLG